MKVLDTDTCIAILRGNQAVIARRAATDDDVVTTWITAAELRYGAAKSVAPEKNHGLVTKFLATLPALGLDAASAQIFGEAKAMLERRGQRLADADLFIGAIAAANQATVVTGNGKHSARIPGVTTEEGGTCGRPARSHVCLTLRQSTRGPRFARGSARGIAEPRPSRGFDRCGFDDHEPCERSEGRSSGPR